LAGPRLAVGGIFDLGNRNQLLAIYDTNGRLLKSLVPAPKLLLQLTPTIDDAFLTVTSTGTIVIGSIVYPTFWLVDDQQVQEVPFLPPSGWHQLTPFPASVRTLQDARNHMGMASHITTAGLVDDSSLIVGWRTGHFSEGSDHLAAISVTGRTAVSLENPVGRLLGVIGTDVLLATEEDSAGYTIAWFGCGPGLAALHGP